MRFLDLVEEDDRVGTAADGLGELPALVVADVARGRADEAGDRVLLHVLRHVDAHHRLLVVEEEFGQRPRQLGLADAGRSHEQERADGPPGIAEARPGSTDGVRHEKQRLVLADHPLPQLVLDVEELLDLALEHPGDGDAGPLRHDLGHVLRVDLLLQHALGLLELGQRAVLLLEVLLEARQRPVADLRRLAKVSLLRRLLGLEARLLDLLLEGADAADGLLLLLPVGLHGRRTLLQVGGLPLDLAEALLRGLVLLLLQRRSLDLELDQLAVDLVDLGRKGVDLDAQVARGLVHEVDGLVGEEAVRDVAVRQRRGCDESRVLDPHAVVDLVLLLEAAQDADGRSHVGLTDVDGLEAPLEGRVLLDVFLVLVQRRRADAAQVAAGQGRLQHVRGVHRSLGRARAHHGVELVDEQDDVAVRLLDLLENGLQAVLEFSPVLRPGDEGAEIEGHDALLLEGLRHVPRDDSLGESFHDGGLAHSRLSDEDRVVLRPAREDLDHAAHFVVAADDRIELPLARQVGQVAGVALEGLVAVLGVRVGHALVPADLPEHLQHGVAGDSVALQGVGRRRLAVEQRQEQVLSGDVLVLERLGFAKGLLQEAIELRRDMGGASLRLRKGGDRRLHFARQLTHVGPELPQCRGDDPTFLGQQRGEKVLRRDLGVVALFGPRLGGSQGLLALYGELIQAHRALRTSI